MLAKLTKYEFRATGRVMLLLYAALLVMTVLNKFVGVFQPVMENIPVFTDLPGILTWILYIVSIAAVTVMTFILIVQRFWKNLLQNEGYLMHVLPVKTWQHIVSKLIPSLVWAALSIIVIMISILTVSGAWADFFKGISYVLTEAVKMYGAGSITLAGVLAALLCLVGAAGVILKFYASMALGQLSDNHKVLASFGAYIGIEVVESIVEMVGLSILSFLFSDFVASLSENQIHNTNLGLFLLLLYCIVNAGVYFIISEVFLRKHLNLE